MMELTLSHPGEVQLRLSFVSVGEHADLEPTPPVDHNAIHGWPAMLHEAANPHIIAGSIGSQISEFSFESKLAKDTVDNSQNCTQEVEEAVSSLPPSPAMQVRRPMWTSVPRQLVPFRPMLAREDVLAPADVGVAAE